MNKHLVDASKDDLALEARSWATKAQALVVADAESCINASHFLRSVKGLRSDIASWFKPHIDAAMETKRTADAARKALVEEQARMEAPLVAAEQTVKRALLAYEAIQEQRRREQERRLQEAARLEAEAQVVETAAALEREAVQTGDAEMLQEAVDILTQPIEAPVVAVPSTMPKVAGVAYRDHWKTHPDIDVQALAQAVGAGLVPTTYLTPNLVALNQHARATEGLDPVPGVRFYNDRTIAARG